MSKRNRDIIVVGASAGGVQALQRLVAGLPPDLPASLFVVLHLWAGSQSFLASILKRAGQMEVMEATNDEPIVRGKIYVAPSDCHLFVERDRVAVLRGPKENRARPAINPLFRSAAAAYRDRVIGVVLTGMLDDGVAGLRAVKQCGGVAIVQSDPEFGEMARAARENVAVDFDVPLAEMPRLLDRLTRERISTGELPPVPEVVQVNDERTKMKVTDFGAQLDRVGKRSLLACPECNGPLWELDEGSLQYRCHVGHAYSAEVLRTAQNVNIEQSLWTALRALKESAALDERLAQRSAEHELDKAAEAHRANSQSKLEQAEHLQQFLAVLRPGES